VSVHLLRDRVVLLRLGGVTLVNFGLMAALGGGLAMLLVLARMFQAGLEPLRYAWLLFVLVPVAAVLGSRLLVVLLHHGSELREAPLQTLLRPGFAFQGGFLVVTTGVAAVALAWRLPLLTLLDCFVLGLPLAHAIGRLGCHGYGCCHGRPTESRLSIRYTNPDAKAVWGSGLAGVPLHPTQLYSALGNLALFCTLNALATQPRAPGLLAALYLLLGSSGRFGIEWLRGIPTRRSLGLSTYQQICLGLLACGAVLIALVWSSSPSSALASWTGAMEGLGLAARHWWFPGLVSLIALLGFGLQGELSGLAHPHVHDVGVDLRVQQDGSGGR